MSNARGDCQSLVDVVMKDSHRVVCGIQISNRTKFSLTDAVVRIQRGRITIPPSTIEPGHTDVMAFRKGYFAPTGTFGTVSWLVEELNRRVYIMWSAPFNFDFYYNVLGVGVSADGSPHPEGEEIFNQMYNGNSDRTLTCQRREYNENSMETVSCIDGPLRVEGTMGNSHKPACKVTVYAV